MRTSRQLLVPGEATSTSAGGVGVAVALRVGVGVGLDAVGVELAGASAVGVGAIRAPESDEPSGAATIPAITTMAAAAPAAPIVSHLRRLRGGRSTWAFVRSSSAW